MVEGTEKRSRAIYSLIFGMKRNENDIQNNFFEIKVIYLNGVSPGLKGQRRGDFGF